MHAKLVKRLVGIVKALERRAQLTRKWSEVLQQAHDRHGVFESEVVTCIHTTELGYRASTLRRGGDDSTKCAMKTEFDPYNACVALSFGCLCLAQPNHERHVTPASEEADPPVEADGHKVRVISEDPCPEEVTLVRPERVAFRISREERRVGDLC